ncbi:hypothetical protein D3C86_1895840 [compost metagenome]
MQQLSKRHLSFIQRLRQHHQKWLRLHKIQLLVENANSVQISVIIINVLIIMPLRLNIPGHRPKLVGQEPLFEQSSGTTVSVVERMDADE